MNGIAITVVDRRGVWLRVDGQAPGVEKHVALEDAIEKVGIGKTQWILLIICGLTFMSDAAEVTFLSYVTEVLRCEWGLTRDQESWITSAVFIGMICGAPIWGYIADKMGRRRAFLLSSSFICVMGFGTALAQGFYSLLVIRAFVGFGVAGLPVGFDILAEALPSSGRGAFLLYIEYFWTLGSIYVNICAWSSLKPMGWQVFTILAALPTLVATIAGYLYLPESPRWLVEVGREEEAVRILNRWAEANGRSDRFEELLPHKVQHASFLDLFKRRSLRKQTLLMGVVWFAFGVAYYGVVMLLPRIFGEKSDNARTGCEVNFDFENLAVSSLFEVIGVVVALLMIDRVGRTKTQSIFYILGGAMALMLGFRSLDIRLLTAVASLGRLAEMAASSATWVHTPEIFPTKVRGQAHALLNLTSKIGAVAAQFFISDTFSQVSSAAIVASMSFIGGVAALFLKETAGAGLEGLDTAEATPVHLEASSSESSDQSSEEE